MPWCKGECLCKLCFAILQNLLQVLQIAVIMCCSALQSSCAALLCKASPQINRFAAKLASQAANLFEKQILKGLQSKHLLNCCDYLLLIFAAQILCSKLILQQNNICSKISLHNCSCAAILLIWLFASQINLQQLKKGKLQSHYLLRR